MSAILWSFRNVGVLVAGIPECELPPGGLVPGRRTTLLPRRQGRVGRKDERKFLDGIFVSQKTLIEPKDAE